jgi:SSS family solute:Na+ symporter
VPHFVADSLLHLRKPDYAILIIYFSFVIIVGVLLRRVVKTGNSFLTSARSVPGWVAGLAFLSANLGAQEVIGMAASGAKYGFMTTHFYWLGAVPAMVFVGVFMLPFYYGSKARSVPEYLKLRYDEKTRGFNAFSFATMTVFSSGVSMYALAALLELLLGWNFHVSLFLSAFIVLAYTFLGGLTAAIYNEVLQFFFIVLGFVPLSLLGLKAVGGWHGLTQKLNEVAASGPVHYPAGAYVSLYRHLGSPHDNPMGVEWFGLVMGLGFVLSFGYWCTDFLVIQRAMAAKTMGAARRTPLIAAIPKMIFPFIIIVPGMVAMALTYTTKHGGGGVDTGGWGGITPGYQLPIKSDGTYDYNMAIPTLLGHHFPSGMLGVGLTALMASFMSGMAGNVTAFNTVWTYDIYESYLAPGKSDQHYLNMGKFATVFGIAASMAAAYVANKFNNIMDLLQLVFAFVNAPLFATFLLGMFWRRSTGHGAFAGMVSGTLAAAVHQGLTLPEGSQIGIHGGWLIHRAVHMYPSEMAQNFWTAIWAFGVNLIVTTAVSLVTKARDEKELVGLVYSLTEKPKDGHLAWWQKPATLAIVVLVMLVLLNLVFA